MPVPPPPTIKSVIGSNEVLIPNGGTTADTSVTLSGTASAGLLVEIFDGEISRGRTTVTSSGTWTLPATALTVGAHSLAAKQTSAEGTSPWSTIWRFTVRG
ncbi:hypothetical protein JMUB6875_41290 [Nocardia sp. JMUB6875]